MKLFGSESGILILPVEEVSEWESDSLKLCIVSVSHLRDGDGGHQIGCYCLSLLLIFPDFPPNCQPCPPNCDSEYVVTFFSMLKKKLHHSHREDRLQVGSHMVWFKDIVWWAKKKMDRTNTLSNFGGKIGFF